MNYKRLFIPNSIVFITVVTYKRQNILLSHIDLLKYAIKRTKQKYKFDIISICVLKNHFHILLKPEHIEEYPNIIKNIKSKISEKFDTTKIADYYVSES